MPARPDNENLTQRKFPAIQYNISCSNHVHSLCAVIPLRPSVTESGSHSTRVESGSNDPVPVYYPGNEISGFMPRRGDFTVVTSTE